MYGEGATLWEPPHVLLSGTSQTLSFWAYEFRYLGMTDGITDHE